MDVQCQGTLHELSHAMLTDIQMNKGANLACMVPTSGSTTSTTNIFLWVAVILMVLIHSYVCLRLKLRVRRPAPCFPVDEIEVEVARSGVPVETRPHIFLACHVGNVDKGTPTRTGVSEKGRGRGELGRETFNHGEACGSRRRTAAPAVYLTTLHCPATALLAVVESFLPWMDGCAR